MTTKEICENLAQVKSVCDRIKVLSVGISKMDKNSPLYETYMDMRVDELEHLQKLVLGVTALIADQESRTDDSAFFAGELNSVKKKPIENEADNASKEVRR